MFDHDTNRELHILYGFIASIATKFISLFACAYNFQFKKMVTSYETSENHYVFSVLRTEVLLSRLQLFKTSSTVCHWT